MRILHSANVIFREVLTNNKFQKCIIKLGVI